MRGLTLFGAVLAGGLIGSPSLAQSDAQIRQRIIRESIASYSGACPCPYNVMRNGRSCGRRSAYSRPGGAAPICYPQDVTQAEVAASRRAHR